MKNKGFTLIELLAVIVILAIIALIATPIILGIINDSKKQSGERSAELYLDAAKKAIASYQARHPDADFSDISECSIETESIICGEYTIPVEMSGQKPNNGGKVLLTNGNVTKVENLNLGGKYYNPDENNKLVASDTPVESQKFSGTIYRNSDDIATVGDPIVPTEKDVYCIILGDESSCDDGGFLELESECEEIVEELKLDDPSYFEDAYCASGKATVGLSSSSYTTDISDITTDVYLKHTVVDDVITESYACLKHSGGDICLEGDNPSAYGSYDGMTNSVVTEITNPTAGSNIAKIYSVKDYFNTCLFSSESSYCYNNGNDMEISADLEGGTVTKEATGFRCRVNVGDTGCH